MANVRLLKLPNTLTSSFQIIDIDSACDFVSCLGRDTLHIYEIYIVPVYL